MACEDWDSAFSHGHWGCLGPSHKRFSLCRRTPPYFPWHSHGCSHHQCFFPFRVMLRFPPPCSLWQRALQANEAPWTSDGRKHFSGLLPHSFLGRSLSFIWNKKRGTTDYFGYLPPLSQTIMCSFKGAFHPKLLPSLQSWAVTSFPFLFPSRCNSPDARAVFASWCCSALQPGPLNKMTPCSLFKPQLFCTAPGTDVCFRALELNSSAPSLWNHLTSHPSDLASSLPTS